MPRSRRLRLVVERTRHGKAVYYVRNGHGPRIRLPDDYGSAPFWRAYDAALSGAQPRPAAPKRPSPTKIAQAAAMNAAHRLIGVARARAARSGLAFDLSAEWATQEIERQKFCCALTGIAFEAGKLGDYRVNPFSPSLDRISAAGGYTVGNARFVLFAVNVMLNERRVEIFEAVVNRYRAHKGSKSRRHSLTLRGE